MACLSAIAGLSAVVGCAEEEIEYREVKRPDELIRAAEWVAFVRIVDQLPEPKLRELPGLQPPLPQWHQARTLPVDELAAEERSRLEKSWDPPRLARDLKRIPGLARLIRVEKMTLEQFVGLALTIGTAMQKARLPEDFPLDDLVRRGNLTSKVLGNDHRLFATLSIEDRHRVLDDAVWLHRVHRARILRGIPVSNVTLVRRHAEWLSRVMPARFEESPFGDVVDLLEEQGVPFKELPDPGSDADLEWSPDEAIVGRDRLPPDDAALP